ncbi:MAG: hypothetical protein J5586_01475 [Clostridia bacterium]|nr:hypothetical protein [Clostridia bacterium]
MYWKNIAVTSGHCIYNGDRGGWATSIVVRPAANGYFCPYGTSNATELHSAKKWVNNGDSGYDYGVIVLSNDIGNSTGWFGTIWRSWSLVGYNVTVAGYPGECFRQMFKMSGQISRSTTRKVYYQIDTTAGQSGSPVYNADGYVYAIHTTGETLYGNGGARITKSLFRFLQSFRQT